MVIREQKEFTPQVLQAVQHLLRLLISGGYKISDSDLKEIIKSNNSHLFFAVDNSKNTLLGMLTVGTYITPTGKKGWIEDVVVDDVFRGRGIGKKLMQHAIKFIESQNIKLLMLTSNPTRIAANNLYQSLGFEKKETNVYKMNIQKIF